MCTADKRPAVENHRSRSYVWNGARSHVPAGNHGRKRVQGKGAQKQQTPKRMHGKGAQSQPTYADGMGPTSSFFFWRKALSSSSYSFFSLFGCSPDQVPRYNAGGTVVLCAGGRRGPR